MRTHDRTFAFYASAREAMKPVVLMLFFGSAALAAGALVYVFGRQPCWGLSFLRAAACSEGSSVFLVIVGNNLPAFSHTYAFALFLIAVLKPSPVRAVGVCSAWLAVEWIFECGQHPMVWRLLSWKADSHVEGSPLWLFLARYFASGTFDKLDLLGCALGAGAALITAAAVRKKGDTS